MTRLLVFGNNKPIWIDEQISINAACGDSTLNSYTSKELESKQQDHLKNGTLVSAIFESNLQTDRGNALLFDYILSGWMLVFGCSLLSVKSISIALSALSIFLMLTLNKSNKSLNLFLILLILSNGLFYRYSLECRTYMLTTAFSLISTSLCFSYLKEKKQSTILFYFICVTLSLFCHYLVLVVFIWHFFLFIYHGSNPEKIKLLIYYFLFSCFILSVLFIIDRQTHFITNIIHANKNISNNLVQGSNTSFQIANFSSISAGILQVILTLFNLSLQSMLQIRFFAILIAIIFFLFYIFYKYNSKSDHIKYFSLFCIHLLFLIVISVLSKNNVIFQINYSIFVLPYYFLFITETIPNIKSHFQKNTLQSFIIAIGIINTIGYIVIER